MKAFTIAASGVLAFVLLTACGEEDSSVDNEYPYDPDKTTIIGRGSTDPVETPDGDDCVDIDGACVAPQDDCGDDGTADVIVDDKGNVVDVICYPTSGAPVEEIPAESVPVEKTQNGSVVVLDAADDGDDIEGDLSVDANNVVIYGESPDVAVIGGDLALTKNNTTVRGVRITGDVSVAYNNANLVFCVIEGDLTILGNNTTVAGCEVWGSVTITGENTVLVSNHLADPGPFAAQGLVCNDNHHVTDVDGDGAIADDEIGDPIECSAKAD